ncbi:MAG: TIGR04133 family radical SAM/SPASM protein [Treponema sp.]|nr:TIGR04133 family radical SAM/SPASM protein [Treponema sp.]MCL2251578.1 TIGR04133 family radical SAM/SPASM protein [Treponema sp.]
MINNFSQFIFNQFRKNEMHLHELNYLFWECTLRCNLQCRHCGSDCKNVSTVKDMPFEDFLNAILPLKEKIKSDSITIAITGGEPLLREDLPQCGIQLRKNGFRWGIVTNGYDYTPEVHSKLLGAGMGTITVSLDGLESSHNWLRANDQSFKRAVNALSLISSSSRLNYDVVTCVNKKNIDELDSLKKYLNDMQIKAWRLFIISPIGRALRSKHNDDLYLTQAQLKQLMDFIVMARNEKRINVSLCCGDYAGEYERKVRDAYYICRAGMHIGSILIDGSISACPNINRCFIQGNIYQDNFLDVWNNRFEIMRNRKWSKTGLCKNCEAFKNCNGGPMHLWDENKDTIMACTYQQIKKS